jgi:hypothetical protein
MRLLFTMVALRVVLAQEEGFGNECHDDPSYTELYDDLTTYLQREPLKDPEAWIEKLLRHPKLNCRLAAVRIIEVRDVYASREFDWGETRKHRAGGDGGVQTDARRGAPGAERVVKEVFFVLSFDKRRSRLRRRDVRRRAPPSLEHTRLHTPRLTKDRNHRRNHHV